MPAMDNDDSLHQLVRQAQTKAIRQRLRNKARPQARQQHPTAQPALSPSQQQGRRAEDLACQHVIGQGARVLARNLRCKAGEIDLVVKERETLVFIEVRQRRSSRFGGAAASVNRNKQRRLTLSAAYFLPGLTRRYFQGIAPACRFDVICIEMSGMTWIKQAFDSNGR
jgi:putative endonuclease